MHPITLVQFESTYKVSMVSGVIWSFWFETLLAVLLENYYLVGLLGNGNDLQTSCKCTAAIQTPRRPHLTLWIQFLKGPPLGRYHHHRRPGHDAEDQQYQIGSSPLQPCPNDPI